MPQDSTPLFHILPRDSKGGLSALAKEHTDKNRIKLSFEREQTPAGQRDTKTVLDAFKKILPKSVTIPDKSPFVVLLAGKPGDISPLAECKCQCSVTADCGGGGGGGGKITDLTAGIPDR